MEVAMEKPSARVLVGLLAIFAIGLVTGCASNPRTSGRVVVHDENSQVEVVFTNRDRDLIRDYYHRHLPPGLAKRSSLPPGLQKQVQRRGHLPPGLEGKHLPHELEVQLSSLPEGYVRLRVGVDVVLMNTHTRVVVDVVKDI